MKERLKFMRNLKDVLEQCATLSDEELTTRLSEYKIAVDILENQKKMRSKIKRVNNTVKSKTDTTPKTKTPILQTMTPNNNISRES